MWSDLNKLIINLPNRVDRIKLFREQSYLPFSNLRVVEGVKHPTTHKGIAQAHLNCISIAKGNEWDSVLIMEDDVYFQGLDKTYNYLLQCLNNLPDKWDVLLGGVYFSHKLVSYNEYWNSVGEFCGLHFYIVNSKAYDTILKYDGKEQIDRWMNLKGRLNCFVTKKFVATQRAGFSDNIKANVEYKRELKKYQLL